MRCRRKSWRKRRVSTVITSGALNGESGTSRLRTSSNSPKHCLFLRESCSTDFHEAVTLLVTPCTVIWCDNVRAGAMWKTRGIPANTGILANMRVCASLCESDRNGLKIRRGQPRGGSTPLPAPIKSIIYNGSDSDCNYVFLGWCLFWYLLVFRNTGGKAVNH